MSLYEKLNSYYPIGGKVYDQRMAELFRIINSQLEDHEDQIKKLQQENKELKELLSTNVPAAEEGAVPSAAAIVVGTNCSERAQVEGQEQKIPAAPWIIDGKFRPVAFFDHIKNTYFTDPTQVLQKLFLENVKNYREREKISFGEFSKTYVEIIEGSPSNGVNKIYIQLKGNQFSYLFMMKRDNFVGEFQGYPSSITDILDKFQFIIGVDNELYILLKFRSSTRKTQLYKIDPNDYEANAKFIISELEKQKKELEFVKV